MCRFSARGKCGSLNETNSGGSWIHSAGALAQKRLCQSPSCIAAHRVVRLAWSHSGVVQRYGETRRGMSRTHLSASLCAIDRAYCNQRAAAPPTNLQFLPQVRHMHKFSSAKNHLCHEVWYLLNYSYVFSRSRKLTYVQ